MTDTILKVSFIIFAIFSRLGRELTIIPAAFFDQLLNLFNLLSILNNFVSFSILPNFMQLN